MKGLEAWCPDLVAVEAEVVHVVVRLVSVIHPMGPHVTHAMEMGSILDGNGGGSDVSDQDALFEDLDPFGSGHGSVDLAAGHQDAGGNDAFDDGELPHDDHTGSVNLTLETSVHSNSAIEVYNSFKLDPSCEKREVVLCRFRGSFSIAEGPHLYCQAFLVV